MVPTHLLERHAVWPYNDRTFLSPQVLITGFHRQTGAVTANQNQYTEANKHSPTVSLILCCYKSPHTIRMTATVKAQGWKDIFKVFLNAQVFYLLLFVFLKSDTLNIGLMCCRTLIHQYG